MRHVVIDVSKKTDEGGYETVVDDGLPDAVAPVPESVTRLQARLALNAAGLLGRVEDAVNTTGGDVLIWYQDAQTWYRNNPILTKLATNLEMTDAQIDALFLTASQIAEG